MLLRPLDVATLAPRFAAARPFPHVVVDDLLEPAFAEELVAGLPDFQRATGLGNRFRSVNEQHKVQITDPARMPEPVRRLLDELHGPAFLAALGALTGVPHLEVDERLIGGGLHVTGRRGRLDVHTDFNYVPDRERFRRLNLLLYLNKDWRPEWGGELELWSADMRRCEARIAPVLGRCVVFATSTTSFHGTTRVTCPRDQARRSLALYYYSHVPPENFDDQFQGTVFKARPDEWWKGRVLMPLERSWHALRYRWQQARAKRGR